MIGSCGLKNKFQVNGSTALVVRLARTAHVYLLYHKLQNSSNSYGAVACVLNYVKQDPFFFFFLTKNKKEQTQVP